jgi:hypothetical protein
MLVEVVMSVMLTASAKRFGSGDTCFYACSGEESCTIAVMGSAESSVLHGVTVESALAADLSSVAEVKRIFVERADGNLLVWVAAVRPSKEIREKIFQKQFDLIDAFPEIEFDFNLVSTDAEFPSEIASEAKLIYTS